MKYVVLALGMLAALLVQAQDLTTTQRTTLRTALFAEPSLQQYLTVRNDDPVAAFCNAPVTPAKVGWKVSNSFGDLFEATDINVYIGRSVAERDALNMLLNAARDNPAYVDATRVGIRTGVTNIFSGTAAAVVATRRAMLTAMTEPVTWCQNVLGTTAATTDTIAGHIRAWAGTLTPSEMSTLLNGD